MEEMWNSTAPPILPPFHEDRNAKHLHVKMHVYCCFFLTWSAQQRAMGRMMWLNTGPWLARDFLSSSARNHQATWSQWILEKRSYFCETEEAYFKDLASGESLINTSFCLFQFWWLINKDGNYSIWIYNSGTLNRWASFIGKWQLMILIKALFSRFSHLGIHVYFLIHQI